MKSTLRNSLIVSLLMVPTLAAVAHANSSVWFYPFETTLDTFRASGLRGEDITSKTLMLNYEQIGFKSGLNGYAALTTYSGGPVWMQATYKNILNPVDNVIRIDFQARDNGACEGCITLVYVGTARPTSLAQFTTDFQSLDGKWRSHNYKIAIPDDTDKVSGGVRAVVVAIGFTHLDGRGSGSPEPQGIGVDNLSLSVMTAPEPPPITN